MALTQVNAGDTITAATFNQILQTLQVPAGGQEIGHYKVAENMYIVAGLFIATYVPTISRNATLVSVTVDTSDDAGIGVSTPPSVGLPTSGGFQLYCTNTSGAASLEGHCGGKYTANY